METQKLSFTTKCFDFVICAIDIYSFNDRSNKDKKYTKVVAKSSKVRYRVKVGIL